MNYTQEQIDEAKKIRAFVNGKKGGTIYAENFNKLTDEEKKIRIEKATKASIKARQLKKHVQVNKTIDRPSSMD